ncbi:hypothetical protein GCM10023335_81730 [Streptomyces siamensis]|uniref:Uncharacterized protein n=1 Tax=Streptomyces siamensis TaxID=1274986 RepID=A0ABP9JNU3_9ACTN
MTFKMRAASLLSAGALLGMCLVSVSATSASAQPWHCYVPANNNSSGVMRLEKTLAFKNGPYSECDDGKFGLKGNKFYIWCFIENSHGNAWYFGREDGTEDKGWVYSGNLTYLSGSLRECYT